MSTNEVFYHLIMLLRLTKEKELIIEMFKAQGFDVTKSKIKAWSFKGETERQMPRHILDAFIDELYKRKLVQE